MPSRTSRGKTMIIETSDNRFYRVTETGNPDLAHVWNGARVKRDRKTGEWVRTGKWSVELVRKAATRVVEA